MAQKVLLIRFSSIGDIVLTSPVIRGLREQAGADIHYLTKQAFRAIPDADPRVSRVYAIRQRVGEVLPDLRAEKYDYVVDLHNNLRSWQVKVGLSPLRTGRRLLSRTFHKINFAKWLMVRTKIDRLPRRHIVERYIDTVRPLGVEYDGRGLDFFIPESTAVDLEELAQVYGRDYPEWAQALRAGRYLCLVIGAAHATKRLTTEQLRKLAADLPKPVLLLGGPADQTIGRLVATDQPGVLDVSGRYSLHGSASLVARSAGLITHDTGLMHIGAALRRPMVSVWGNTIPQFGMYPLYPSGADQNTTFEVGGLRCRPCSKIGYAQCPQGHFRCMRDQDLNQIIERAREFSGIQA